MFCGHDMYTFVVRPNENCCRGQSPDVLTPLHIKLYRVLQFLAWREAPTFAVPPTSSRSVWSKRGPGSIRRDTSAFPVVPTVSSSAAAHKTSTTFLSDKNADHGHGHNFNVWSDICRKTVKIHTPSVYEQHHFNENKQNKPTLCKWAIVRLNANQGLAHGACVYMQMWLIQYNLKDYPPPGWAIPGYGQSGL